MTTCLNGVGMGLGMEGMSPAGILGDTVAPTKPLLLGEVGILSAVELGTQRVPILCYRRSVRPCNFIGSSTL